MNRNWTWKMMTLLVVGVTALAGCAEPDEEEAVGDDELGADGAGDDEPEPDVGPFEEPEPDIGPAETPGAGD